MEIAFKLNHQYFFIAQFTINSYLVLNMFSFKLVH